MTKGPSPKLAVDRFMQLHAKDMASGCWNWTGALRKGYASFRVGSHLDGTRKTVYAHRFVWEQIHGPIPQELQIDHLCRNPRCVNPEHMELVTARANTLRGNTITANNLKKTHCHRGHEFTPENTYTFRGMRHCRACQRINLRQYRERQR